MPALAPASHWILEKYRQLEIDLENNLETYTLGHSVDSLYRYVWDAYADWYVEYLKTDKSQVGFARELYTQLLVVLHPYMPFETEVLWKKFAGRETLLAKERRDMEFVQRYALDSEQAAEFGEVITVIERLRSLRGLFAIDPGTKLEIVSNSELLAKYSDYLGLLGKTTVRQGDAASYRLGLLDISIEILDYVPDKQAEAARTHKLITSLEKQIKGLTAKLGNEKFLANAEAETVQEARENLAARQQELESQRQKLSLLD